VIKLVVTVLFLSAVFSPLPGEEDVIARANRSLQRAQETLERARRARAKRRTANRTARESRMATATDSPAAAAESVPLPEEAPSPPVPEEPLLDVVSLSIEQLEGFDRLDPQIRDLLTSALALTERKLRLTPDSIDPQSGGLDAGGLVYYLLQQAGVHTVPKTSAEQYLWARKEGDFHAVLSRNPASSEFDQLQPGNLLFWCAIDAWDSEVLVTEVALYLGAEKGSGKRVMVGASDGQVYGDKPRYGVSVLELRLSGADSTENYLLPRLVGYSRIPGLGR
jgi:cell wall-associated NlpC family hydrolase